MFDGIKPNDSLSPRTIDACPALLRAWEEDLARRDDEIAEMMRCRAAHVRNIAALRRRLK